MDPTERALPFVKLGRFFIPLLTDGSLFLLPPQVPRLDRINHAFLSLTPTRPNRNDKSIIRFRDRPTTDLKLF